MLEVNILSVGNEKEEYYADACREYEKRLSAFCSLKNKSIKDEKLPQNASEAQINAALQKEGAAILGAIPERSYNIAMCIEGKELSSEQLAKLFEDAAGNGYSKISFVIGSSCGLSQDIKQKCDFCLSMSKMTFPHRLARVMLLEQIYRAFTINANMKYHK